MGVGGGAESLCLCQWTQQRDSGARLHLCSQGKLLSVGAAVEEEGPGVPAGHPKRVRLLCAKALPRADKYRQVCYLFFFKKNVYNHFKSVRSQNVLRAGLKQNVTVTLPTSPQTYARCIACFV